VSAPYLKGSVKGYRLPTDEQWRYAARGGVSSRRFPWGGDSINHDYANYRANGSAYTYDTSPYTSYTFHPDYSTNGLPYTSPVGAFVQNGYGLCDMVGNVREWCYDWRPGYEGSSRMLCGGSWLSDASYCRVALRYSGSPGLSDWIFGFRAVLPVAPEGMVLIPGGSNRGTDPDYGPYSLTVDSFFMDRYEVTKELWDEVKNWSITNGYVYDNAGSGKATNHPVHTVNWYDCVKWCNARSQKAGWEPVYYTDGGFTQIYKTGQVYEPYVKSSANGYRLPTDEQWEYAARGGVASRRFPWGGDTINHDYANYWANGSAYTYDTSPYTSYTSHPDYDDGGYPYTSPVGTFETGKNAYGLYDMTGNVWEWCYVWYLGYEGSIRVNRGGGWNGTADFCRVALRSGYYPGGSSYDLGFRAVLPPGQY